MYIWQPPLSPRGEGHWIEAVQAYTQEWALYVAGLMHQDRRSVIKVVRYGLNIQCNPDAHAVELVERQIARQRAHPTRAETAILGSMTRPGGLFLRPRYSHTTRSGLG